MPENKVPVEVWQIESKRVARMNALTQARSILAEIQRKDNSYTIKREHVTELAEYFYNWIIEKH